MKYPVGTILYFSKSNWYTDHKTAIVIEPPNWEDGYYQKRTSAFTCYLIDGFNYLGQPNEGQFHALPDNSSFWDNVFPLGLGPQDVGDLEDDL